MRKHSQIVGRFVQRIAVCAAVVAVIATAAPRNEYTKNDTLFAAVYEGNHRAIQDFLATGADPNITNAEGTPALFIAALQNDYDSARMLIKAGADVNRTSKIGRTALHVAASTEGAWRITKLLLDSGAQTNVHDKAEGMDIMPVGSGYATALIEAAKVRDSRSLKLILEKGADINATERGGATALMAAAVYGNRESVKMLIAAGSNVNAANKFGLTALALGVIRDDVEIVRMLLDAGAKVNTTDLVGMTPVSWAAYAESGKAEIVDLLIKAGADLNVKNKMGDTPMVLAVRHGESPIVARLRAAGLADVAREKAIIPEHEAVAVQTAIEKAIVPLQKSGPEFLKKSGCVSCHHQNLTAIATGLANQAGYSYDEKVAEMQQKAVINRFRPAHAVLLENSDVLPEMPLHGSYQLLGLAAEGYPFDATVDAMVRHIAAKQMPDGSWIAWAPRPPLGSGYIRATVLSARALQLYTPPGLKKEFESRIAKAREYLRTAQPATIEERAMQLRGLAWTGASKQDILRVSALLLREQQGNGGWPQKPSLDADAYATSEALLALHDSGSVKVTDAAYKRGVDYLLRTQFEDGTWLVKTRAIPFQPLVDSGFPHGRDQWISSAATALAIQALEVTAAASEPVRTARFDR